MFVIEYLFGVHTQGLSSFLSVPSGIHMVQFRDLLFIGPEQSLAGTWFLMLICCRLVSLFSLTITVGLRSGTLSTMTNG